MTYLVTLIGDAATKVSKKLSKSMSDFAFVCQYKAIKLKSAWGQAREVVSCWKDGYPASLAEIFDDYRALRCNIIRKDTAMLIEDFPRVGKKVIMESLTSPSRQLRNMSPFDVVSHSDDVAVLGMVKFALRDPVYRCNDSLRAGM